MKRIYNKKGTIFVEASLIIPMIMIIAVIIINVTLGYYKGVSEQAEKHRIQRTAALDDGAVNNGECEFARRADLFID